MATGSWLRHNVRKAVATEPKPAEQNRSQPEPIGPHQTAPKRQVTARKGKARDARLSEQKRTEETRILLLLSL